jgi:hypothetical protein
MFAASNGERNTCDVSVPVTFQAGECPGEGIAGFAIVS